MKEIKNNIFVKKIVFFKGGGQFKILMYEAHRSSCFQSMGKFVLKKSVIQDH